MLWKFRHLLFSYKAPGIYFKSLSDVPKQSLSKPDADSYSTCRVSVIDKAFETHFYEVLPALDFKLPFTISEARDRLARGEIFITISHKNNIAGWIWFAMNQAYCSDLDCSIGIRKGQAYAYNLFVSKMHRGRALAAELLIAAEYHLASKNVTDTWALIYDWNTSSQKALIRAGYSQIGSYRVWNILGMRFHHFPPPIRG